MKVRAQFDQAVDGLGASLAAGKLVWLILLSPMWVPVAVMAAVVAGAVMALIWLLELGRSWARRRR